MNCIYCGKNTLVSNSRLQKRNNQVWRRRKCSVCQAVFTTTEKAILGPDMAFLNKSGELIQFKREVLLGSLMQALGGNFEHYPAAENLTDNIIGRLLQKKIGSVIERTKLVALCKIVLKSYNRSAYLRYVAEHG